MATSNDKTNVPRAIPPHLRGITPPKHTPKTPSKPFQSEVSFPRAPSSKVDSVASARQENALPPHLRSPQDAALTSSLDPEAHTPSRVDLPAASEMKSAPTRAQMSAKDAATQLHAIARARHGYEPTAPSIPEPEPTSQALTNTKKDPKDEVPPYPTFFKRQSALTASRHLHPCPYKGCHDGFKTSGGLKAHMKGVHDYCGLCNIPFADDDEYLQHRIKSERHMTCPFCGEDFRSESGCLRHIRQAHIKEQNIKCHGCGEFFVRAGSMMEHLEKNRCTRISRSVFEKYRAMKAFRAAQVEALQPQQEYTFTTAEGKSDAAEDPDEEGGVKLIDLLNFDENDETQYTARFQTMREGSSPIMGMDENDEDVYAAAFKQDVTAESPEDAGLEDMTEEDMMKYIAHQPLDFTEELIKRSVKWHALAMQQAQEAPNVDVPTKERPWANKAVGGSTTSKRIGGEVVTSPVTDATHSLMKLQVKETSPPCEAAKTEKASSVMIEDKSSLSNPNPPQAPAWATKTPSGMGTAASEIFKGAKPTPMTDAISGGILSGEANRLMLKDTEGNFLDPSSKLFDPSKFRNPIGNYKCPYPACGRAFPTTNSFTQHLLSPIHRGVDHRCPQCLKIFRSPTALTQHMESPSERCKIKETGLFGQAISLVSGGFVEVAGLDEEGHVVYASGGGFDAEDGIGAMRDEDW